MASNAWFGILVISRNAYKMVSAHKVCLIRPAELGKVCVYGAANGRGHHYYAEGSNS